MPTILDTILETKRDEVRLLKRNRSFCRERTDTPRSLFDALNNRPALSIIAEVKKASPSRGVIQPDFDPASIAAVYQEGGANAVSVLTDEHYFQGQIEYLTTVRNTVSMPVLRKDFIIDPLQVEQTAGMNADALLLIVAALSDSQLAELAAAARELQVETLVEIHNGHELERAMNISPPLIGINNRDLATFNTDLATTLSLIPDIPDDTVVVSESGIFTKSDTAPLIQAGVSAILVGESLMRHERPAELIAALCHRGS